MDIENDRLYKIVNGILSVVSPDNCELLDTMIYPGIDVEGMALDAETQRLYGLVRHFEGVSAFEELHVIELAAGAPYAWKPVGSTGTTWANAGLALDPQAGVLYAVGNRADPGGLYRINPSTGAIQRVGDTGLAEAIGGLAWVPSPADR